MQSMVPRIRICSLNLEDIRYFLLLECKVLNLLHTTRTMPHIFSALTMKIMQLQTLNEFPIHRLSLNLTEISIEQTFHLISGIFCELSPIYLKNCNIILCT